MILTRPWSPSANGYYRHVGHRTLISREGRAFRQNVCALLAGGGHDGFTHGERLAMVMDVFPPDRRRRNIDNLQKPVIDAVEHAGIYANDNQIDMLITRRCEVVPAGRILIDVMALPLSLCPLCGHAMPVRMEPQ